MSSDVSGGRRPWQPEDLRKLVLPEEVALSPNGRRLVWTEHTMAPQKDEYRGGMTLAFLNPSGTVREKVDLGGGSAPRWSPDGRRLAYSWHESVHWRSRVGGYKNAHQLYVLDADKLDRDLTRRPAFQSTTLTDTPHDVVDYAWSPDSRELAICFAEMSPDDAGALELKRARGISVPRVRRITKADYKLDSFAATPDEKRPLGFTYEFSWNLGVVDAETGEFRALTSGPGSRSSPAWSPDGGRIAFLSSEGNGDDRPRFDIWVVNSDGTGSHRLSTDDRVSAASTPVWSPDGEHIAFLGTTYPNWMGHEDLYVMRADGTGLRNITAGQPFTMGDQALDDVRDGEGEMLWWSADGTAIEFAASQNGSVQIRRADLSADRTRAKRFIDLSSGEQRIYSASAARGGKVAFAASTWDHPGDVFLYSRNQGTTRRITAFNEELLAKRITHVPEPLEVTAPDGLAVQAWIMRSKTSTEERRPTIVEVHGGPAAMYGASFFLEWQIMAGAGYNIAFGNPRGSTGYGRDWSSRVFGDLGGGDFRDVMAITDAAVASGGVDEKRLGIEGGSYGGFMTNWAIGQTDRFAAAVAGRSISNWMSFWGTSDGGRYAADEMGGTPWEKTGEYLKRSPISCVKRIRTPLLLMHSDNDLRCPLEQAEQMYSALKHLGREVELDIAENQSHELSRSGSPRLRVQRLQRIREWFDRHLMREIQEPGVGGAFWSQLSA